MKNIPLILSYFSAQYFEVIKYLANGDNTVPDTDFLKTCNCIFYLVQYFYLNILVFLNCDVYPKKCVFISSRNYSSSWMFLQNLNNCIINNWVKMNYLFIINILIQHTLLTINTFTCNTSVISIWFKHQHPIECFHINNTIRVMPQRIHKWIGSHVNI